jgi:hypothetical protein
MMGHLGVHPICPVYSLKEWTFISIQYLPLLTYAISTYKTKPILGEKKISERPFSQKKKFEVEPYLHLT